MTDLVRARAPVGLPATLVLARGDDRLGASTSPPCRAVSSAASACVPLSLSPHSHAGRPPPTLHPFHPVIQGPQYVVTDFNIFVCAVCSGVQYVLVGRGGRRFCSAKKKRGGRGKGIHARALLTTPPPPLSHPTPRSRQFNHRCKGVTMATFKPEEIQAIEDGGNAVRKQKKGRRGARWPASERHPPNPQRR